MVGEKDWVVYSLRTVEAKGEFSKKGIERQDNETVKSK